MAWYPGTNERSFFCWASVYFTRFPNNIIFFLQFNKWLRGSMAVVYEWYAWWYISLEFHFYGKTYWILDTGHLWLKFTVSTWSCVISIDQMDACDSLRAGLPDYCFILIKTGLRSYRDSVVERSSGMQMVGNSSPACVITEGETSGATRWCFLAQQCICAK